MANAPAGRPLRSARKVSARAAKNPDAHGDRGNCRQPCEKCTHDLRAPCEIEKLVPWEPVRCAGLDIPEFVGGTTSQAAGPTSSGAFRTARLMVTAQAFAASLLDWAEDIEAEDGQRCDADRRTAPEGKPPVVKPGVKGKHID